MRKSFKLTHHQQPSKIQPKTTQQSIRTGKSLKTYKPIFNNNPIETLIQTINQGNHSIKQTQKLLDVDLFLKTQKEKRLQYAKELNTQFQQQKKKRQQKLYNKFKREERDEGFKEVQKIRKSAIPLSIIKIFNFPKQHQLSNILLGHHHQFNSQQVKSVTYQQLKQSQNLVKKQLNVWKNVKQVAKNILQLSIFPINIANCQLEASEQGQNLMNGLVLMNNDIQFGKYHYECNQQYLMCRFYERGIKKTIVSTCEIQVKEYEHKYINVGSRTYSGNMFGTTLIEKCYKMLKLACGEDNIRNLSLLEVIYDIYGLDAQIVPIHKKSLIIQNFPKVIYSQAMDNCRIGFFNQNLNNQIYKNRIYPLNEIIIKTFKKNTTQFQYKLSNPWRGKLLTSDNLNVFNINQLLQKFDRLIIIRDYPINWYGLRIKVSFFSNGAINNTSNQWTKNSQYLFTITKPMNIRILLRRIKDQQGNNQQQNKKGYGFLLFHNKEGNSHVSCMKIDDLIIKIRSSQLNGATYSTNLQIGNYILIPFCEKVSIKQYKFYYLDFFVQKKDYFTLGKAKFTDYYFQNRKTQDDKIIQKLETTQKFQKPKFQELFQPQKFVKKNNHLKNVVKITVPYLQSLTLTLYKQVRLQSFFIPGQIYQLIINKKIEIEQEKVQKKQRNQKQSQAPNQNIQLTQCQRQQNLNILIGYDAIDEDTNKGKMKQIIQSTDDEIDFENFQLGPEGIIAIMQPILQKPIIKKINLTNNCLNDQAISYICYYLEKSNRVELKQLNISRNQNIGKVGKAALKGLAKRLKNISIIGLKQKDKKQ